MRLQRAAIASLALVCRHRPHASLMRIESREQRGPRGATASAVIELRKTQSAGCQCVEIRCADFPAIAAKVRIAQIVCQDQEDIQPPRISGECLTEQKAGCCNGKQAKSHGMRCL